MFEIIITACLLADPEACTTQRVAPLAHSETQLQCMRSFARLEVVEWQRTNPHCFVKRWRCMPTQQIGNTTLD